MANKFLIDIKRVESTLLAVQRDFENINSVLEMRREYMRDEIVTNMVAGYEYVNTILIKEINLLERNGLHHLLELNNIVLCGTGLKRRKDYIQHVRATSDRFYEQKAFSISDLRSWAEKRKNDSPWRLAAGAYILQVSLPQLFAEGNHRTGALLMSSLLVRCGEPPFVLSVDNAKGYFDPSSLAKSTPKNLLGRYYKLPKIKKRFAKFLEEHARHEFLRPRSRRSINSE